MRRALAFLTPLGGASAPDARTLEWFPLAGALIGLVLAGVWWGALRLWPPVAAAAVLTAADLVLTGALHFDGLVDTADGLLPHLPPERRLAVMEEPCVGAFGTGAGACALLLRFGALSTFPHARPWLLVATWSASRASMTVAARVLPYARPGGLASAFAGRPSAATAVAVLLPVGLGVAGGAVAGAAVAAALASAAGVHALAARRLGGYTGDTLGAAGFAAETVGLLAGAALA